MHLRVYTKSHFLEYLSHSTFACAEYPGPLRHWCIGTENQIIDVVSVEAPEIKQVGGTVRPIHVH